LIVITGYKKNMRKIILYESMKIILLNFLSIESKIITNNVR